jgi:hypothetical protein
MLPEQTKADFYSLVTYVRIANEYAEMLLRQETYALRGEAKQAITFIRNATHRFYADMKNVVDEPGRKRLEEEFEIKDFLAWASITQSLINMTDEQIIAVELFCNDLLNGKLKIKDDAQQENAENAEIDKGGDVQ